MNLASLLFGGRDEQKKAGWWEDRMPFTEQRQTILNSETKPSLISTTVRFFEREYFKKSNWF